MLYGLGEPSSWFYAVGVADTEHYYYGAKPKRLAFNSVVPTTPTE